MSNHVYIIPLLLLFVNNYFIISNIIFLINMHELNFLQIFKAPTSICADESPPRMRGKALYHHFQTVS